MALSLFRLLHQAMWHIIIGFFLVFFVCIIDIVNMVTILVEVCYGTHCEVAIALMFQMPGEFNIQYYFVVDSFMLQWWW